MDNISGKYMLQYLAVFFVGSSAICGFLSFVTKFRTHAARLSAVYIVAAISLVSNHWTTYLAAVFIIATAITELDFLQNLAAIIRGDKNYFDYKKSVFGREEAEKKVVRESQHVQAAMLPHCSDTIAESIESCNVKYDPEIILNAKQSALSKLEKQFCIRLERNVRLTLHDISVEIDGLLRESDVDIVYEVRYLPSLETMKPFLFLAYGLEHIITSYQSITGRTAELNLVVVIPSAKIMNTEAYKNLVNDLEVFLVGAKIHTIVLEYLCPEK